MQKIQGAAGFANNPRPFQITLWGVVSPKGYIFENAKGGPYKYGLPLPVTVDYLRALEAGVL